MASSGDKKRKILQEISDNSCETSPKTPKRSQMKRTFSKKTGKRAKQLSEARRKAALAKKAGENVNNNSSIVSSLSTQAESTETDFVADPTTAKPTSSAEPPSADCSLVKGPSECSSEYKLRVMKLATGDIETTKGILIFFFPCLS